jgi:hypothetical protein
MFKSLLTVLCLVPVVAAADTFYLEESRQPSEVSGSVQRLMESELSAKGHTIVDRNANPQWVLKSDAIKLGSSYIVSLTKLKDGTMVYSDKLKADSLNNLDVVSARLVSGALDNVAAEKNIAVDTVTNSEAKGATVKTKATRQTFLGFGPCPSLQILEPAMPVSCSLSVRFGE